MRTKASAVRRVVGAGVGIALLGCMASTAVAQGEEVGLLPEEAAKLIAAGLNEPDITHVIAVRPNGERVILLREGIDYLDLGPGAVPVGFPEEEAAVERVVVRFGGSIWYEGSECHIEMQGGSPKLVPNTAECREKLSR